VSKFARSAVIAAGILLGLQGSSRAGLTTILDQIGPNPSDLLSGTPYTSQIFGAPFTRDNLAVIDNFSITSPGTTLTQVDAAIVGIDGFTSGDFNDVTALHVEIYSSVAAAASSLTGDVYDFSAPKADITLTTPYGSDQYSALAQINVNVTLGVGTYYLAVIPSLNYENTGGAEIGVYASTYAGDSNAYQVNPGGGFGFTDNTNALGVNAAYRILGNVPAVVPEPSSLVMLSTGLALAFRRSRRARASRSRDVEEDALDY
jgi:PEP-CTERM motif